MKTIEKTTQEKNSEKQWWIEFDPSNGKIEKVSRKKPNSKKTNLLEKTDKSDLCKKIVNGMVNISTCAMIQDFVTNEWSLEEQKNELIIKNIDNRLSRIIEKDPSFSDINIIFYRNENYVRISVNVDNIRKSMNLADVYSVSTESHTLMNLYLTQKGDPDFLVGVLEVDPSLLFERHSLLFDVSDIMSIHTIEDLDIFTNQLFSNYSLEIIDSMKIYGKLRDKKIIKTVSKNELENCDINISVVNSVLEIESTLDNNNHYRALSRRSLDLMFFDNDIDNFCGGVSIPTKNLLGKEITKISMDFNIPDNPLIIFKDLELVINYVGENNE